MAKRLWFPLIACAGLIASALLSGCGSSSSTTIPATATVFYAHTAVFSNTSTLLATGYNAFGQLGIGNKDTKDTLTPVVGLGRVSGVALGADHTVAFANQTTVYAWGSNYHGQIGSAKDITGVNAYSSVPVKVPGPKDLTSSTATNQSWGTVSAVAAGGFHSLAVGGPDRRVYAWGYNGYGQLGNGLNFTDAPTPDIRGVQVAGSGTITNLADVIQVAAGGAHSLALKSDGTVYAWGDNTYGQLGVDPTVPLGTYANTASQLQKRSVDTDPTSPLTQLTNISQIAAGGVTSYALETGGRKLWGWGYNAGGQLGLDPTIPANLYVATPRSITLPSSVSATNPVKKISAGNDHLLILLADGTVWGIGFNRYAQLGNNDKATANSPFFVQVVQMDNLGHPLTVATDILAFGNQSLAKFGNAWYGWGDNGLGQLGQPIATSSIGYQFLPTVVRGF